MIPHPASPPVAVSAVEVEAAIVRGKSVLIYRVTGGPVSIPPTTAPARTDGLWQTTCFELFIKPVGGEGYFEFNFSPSTAWAAYRFDGYREGMADQSLDAPRIEPVEDGILVRVDLGGLPEGDWHAAITAVIEETNGTKSYWSIAHPAEKPDFHAAANFALELVG
ncbi:DOMON-like domain-containing protein [Sphingomonas sp. R-74633]|nr:DOMON-like domain-containing protein [Sphingomonas sp. R-74633]NYT39628.1 DOMON-like domain-containing protein [Sphingomonas sp. R-74633]